MKSGAGLGQFSVGFWRSVCNVRIPPKTPALIAIRLRLLIDQRHRTTAARVLRSHAAPVRLEPPPEIDCDAAENPHHPDRFEAVINAT